MRKVKLALMTGLLAVAAAAGATIFTAAPAQAGPTDLMFCTNTGCDAPGQSACPFLEGANCANTAEGCVGWAMCRET